MPITNATDAVIANLESPITTTRARWGRTLKWFHFRADPAAVDILKRGNVRFVCLANNHILDFREAGLAETCRHLDAAGIAHAGAGANAVQAATPVLLEFGGLRVGFCSATDGMPEFAASSHHPGTNVMEFRAKGDTIDRVQSAIQYIRKAGADLVVLSLHWGPNLRLTPPARFREFAQAAIDAGADIIHGHSAHLFQAVELYRHGLILYDTGNFIDDYWKFPFRHTFWAFAFVLEIENKQLRRLRFVPVQTHPWPPRIAIGRTGARICDLMRSLCRPYGTPLDDTNEGLAAPISEF